MLITGRFSDYPLPLLLEIFLHRSETGLLEVLSPSESGHIYIKDGKLVDAKLGKQVGIEAVSFADTLTDSTFRFNSLPPAEYARLVWEKSLESRRSGLPDLHSLALAVYSRIRRVRVYAATGFPSLETLRSATKTLLAQASAAYKRQKQATRTGLAVLQRRVVDWQTYSRAQQIQVPNVRISNLVPVLQRERILAFFRKTHLPSLLKQEHLRRNSFAVITMALLGAMLVFSARHIELRRNQTHTSTAGNEFGKLGVESQAQSTLVLSNPSGLANDPRVTGPGLTQKGTANNKENLQRSARKIPSENSRETNMTKETKAFSEKKTLPAAQPSANLADDSASSQPQALPTNAVQTISVVLQVEDGHVTQASLVERRPGMESYEAAALRIARQRRYPAGAKRTDTLVVKVNKSHSN